MQTEHTYVLWYFSQYFYLFGKLKYFQAMKEHTFVLANKPSQKVLICNLMSYKIIFIFTILLYVINVLCSVLFSFPSCQNSYYPPSFDISIPLKHITQKLAHSKFKSHKIIFIIFLSWTEDGSSSAGDVWRLLFCSIFGEFHKVNN